jgi:hypothetical protein
MAASMARTALLLALLAAHTSAVPEATVPFSHVPSLQDITAEHMAPERHQHRVPAIMPSLGQPISAFAPWKPVAHQGRHKAATAAPPTHPNPLVFPTDFGADPTGHEDSTAAFAAAMGHILQRNSTLGRKFSQQAPSIDKPFANVCADMGGATLHLGGGDCPRRPGAVKRHQHLPFFLCESVLYGAFVWARRALNSRKRRFSARADTISAPIIIPCHVCNMRIHGGTLRASNTFPQNGSFLLQSGGAECGADNMGAPEFVGFSELMLDGRLRRGPSVIISSSCLLVCLFVCRITV